MESGMVTSMGKAHDTLCGTAIPPTALACKWCYQLMDRRTEQLQGDDDL